MQRRCTGGRQVVPTGLPRKRCGCIGNAVTGLRRSRVRGVGLSPCRACVGSLMVSFVPGEAAEWGRDTRGVRQSSAAKRGAPRIGACDRWGFSERLLWRMETATHHEARASSETLLLTLTEVATQLRCTRRSVERRVRPDSGSGCSARHGRQQQDSRKCLVWAAQRYSNVSRSMAPSSTATHHTMRVVDHGVATEPPGRSLPTAASHGRWAMRSSGGPSISRS